MDDPIPNRLAGPTPIPNTLADRSPAPRRVSLTAGDDREPTRADLEAATPLFLTLPDGWRPGIRPDAAAGAWAAVSTPDVVAAAYDGRSTTLPLAPNAVLLDHGALEPGDDMLLDAQEDELREGMARVAGALTRVHLPAGDALRAEFPTMVGGVRVTLVQYYVLTEEGYFAIWCSCLASGLAASLPDFEAIARSLLQ